MGTPAMRRAAVARVPDRQKPWSVSSSAPIPLLGRYRPFRGRATPVDPFTWRRATVDAAYLAVRSFVRLSCLGRMRGEACARQRGPCVGRPSPVASGQDPVAPAPIAVGGRLHPRPVNLGASSDPQSINARIADERTLSAGQASLS